MQQAQLDQQREFKKAMLQKMFPRKGAKEPKIRFDGFSGEWEEKKLGEMVKINTGNSDLKDADNNGSYPFFVRSANIERSNKYLFDGEAILIPGEGKIGDIFHYINGKFDFHQRVYKISNFDGLTGKFTLYIMQLKFKHHAMKHTVKATVDSLRMPMITEFEILIPSLEEQTKIGNFFKSLDDNIEILDQQLEQTKTMKQALLQKMFI